MGDRATRIEGDLALGMARSVYHCWLARHVEFLAAVKPLDSLYGLNRSPIRLNHFDKVSQDCRPPEVLDQSAEWWLTASLGALHVFRVQPNYDITRLSKPLCKPDVIRMRMGEQTHLNISAVIAQSVESMEKLLPVGWETGIDHRERIIALDEIPIDAITATSIHSLG